jgi:regulator of telomere elongation helicase 1
MKDLMDHMETSGFGAETSAAVRDFNQDDLCLLKTMFLELEKAIDDVQVNGEGSTYPGQYIYEILGKADLTTSKVSMVQSVIDKLVQYLATSSASPVQRLGAGLQKFSELITVVFNNRGDKEDPSQSYYKVGVKVSNCYEKYLSCVTIAARHIGGAKEHKKYMVGCQKERRLKKRTHLELLVL